MSSRQAVNLDYLHYLRQALLRPLQRSGAEGAGEAVQILDDYQLIKEDVDSMMEISVWGNQADPYSKLDSKVSRSGLSARLALLNYVKVSLANKFKAIIRFFTGPHRTITRSRSSPGSTIWWQHSTSI